jgi:hypothetical protein
MEMTMKRDGREVARQNELRVLKALHKYGWLRTRDLAALLWIKTKAKSQGDFVPTPIVVAASGMRMAQRTLLRLRHDIKVLWLKAPDGSTIYGLSEAGARQLVGLGIPAKSGKDQVRRVSMAHYHHRRLANEIAIVAQLHGYRVATETEIAAGQWLGGMAGINGKKPDVLVREGRNIWWVEVERSRRNAKDYGRLMAWLKELWPVGPNAMSPATLPDGHQLMKVLFVCDGAFVDHLVADLQKVGWTEMQINQRISPTRLLYVSEAKFLTKGQT